MCFHVNFDSDSNDRDADAISGDNDFDTLNNFDVEYSTGVIIDDTGPCG